MKKFTLVALLCFIFAIAGLYATAKFFIPPSIEVYFAGVAGCDIDDEVLGKNNPQFQKIKWWERLLTHIYRFEQENLQKEFVITDFLIKSESVYHILLTASDDTGAYCDSEIISLIKIYKELNAPIDHYNKDGWTALHVAVITKNEPIIKSLLNNGANANLKNLKIDSSISGMNATEMASFFLSKKPDDSKMKSILKSLKNEI